MQEKDNLKFENYFLYLQIVNHSDCRGKAPDKYCYEQQQQKTG